MSARSDMPDEIRVWHYDGQTATRREPVLIDEGTTFRLIADAWTSEPVAYTDLVPRDPIGGLPTYGQKQTAGWKIGFFVEPPAWLIQQLPPPRRYGGLIDRIGLWPAAAAFAVVGALAVFLVVQSPTVLARLIPPEIERRLGDAMIGDFGGQGCTRPDGVAAIEALKNRLGPEFQDSNISVANIAVNNAVTLPGGRIVLFNGLVKDARSPDELAGIIGHELGHVAHRDVLASLLRQLGLSALLGGLDGNIGGYTNLLLSTAYSRDAETKADQFAIATLNRHAISPAPTAGFFRRLERKTPGLRGSGAQMLAYISSHPVSTARAAQFEAAATGRQNYRPALAPGQWAALRSICDGKKPGRTTIFGF